MTTVRLRANTGSGLQAHSGQFFPSVRSSLSIRSPRFGILKEVIASYVRPDDVVVDVGGGAGRVCLPLALQCKEVLNIEPSPGMDGVSLLI